MAEQCKGLVSALYRIHRYPTTSRSSIQDLDHEMRTVEQSTTAEIADPETPRGNFILYGRHGDLKPENILWYPDYNTIGHHGVLKITDFGAAHFSVNDERSLNDRKTGKMPKLFTHRSPEFDIGETCSTLCDIWSLGCIFLEFVTWYFGGPKYVEAFAKQRATPDRHLKWKSSDTFFTTFEGAGVCRAEVKKEVVQVRASSRKLCQTSLS